MSRGFLTYYVIEQQFKSFVSSLTPMERELLRILREEYIMDTRSRWFKGKQVHTQPDRPKPKARFFSEVSRSITAYYDAYAGLRLQFYLHFGTDEEIEYEKEWYRSYDGANSRLHANRDGRYHRN